MKTEIELVEAIQAAEQSENLEAIENSVSSLALFYVVTGDFTKAAPFWRRGAKMLSQVVADSPELGTYLQNMAEMCLIPAQLWAEARQTLEKARAIYSHHYKPEADLFADINALLKKLP